MSERAEICQYGFASGIGDRRLEHQIRNPLVQCDQDPSLGGSHGDYFVIWRAGQILLAEGGALMT